MNATATELANDSKGLLDAVIARGVTVNVTRHGVVKAQIQRVIGVDRAEFIRRMKQPGFTPSEAAEYREVIAEAGKVFSNAGGD